MAGKCTPVYDVENGVHCLGCCTNVRGNMCPHKICHWLQCCKMAPSPSQAQPLASVQQSRVVPNPQSLHKMCRSTCWCHLHLAVCAVIPEHPGTGLQQRSGNQYVSPKLSYCLSQQWRCPCSWLSPQSCAQLTQPAGRKHDSIPNIRTTLIPVTATLCMPGSLLCWEPVNRLHQDVLLLPYDVAFWQASHPTGGLMSTSCCDVIAHQ
jgi:hypothetical protein